MEITYKTRKIEKVCTIASEAEKKYGSEMAEKIHQRIDEIDASDTIDYSLVIAPVVADLCTTPVALSAPPNSYQNNSQS